MSDDLKAAAETAEKIRDVMGWRPKKIEVDDTKAPKRAAIQEVTPQRKRRDMDDWEGDDAG